MRKMVGILVLVAMVFLLRVPEVPGGAGALALPDKTTGPAVSATIVVKVPGGETTIRAQKGGASTAVRFTDTRALGQGCITTNFPGDLEGSTNDRYLGFMNGWVPTYSPDPKLLGDLVGGFGPTQQAVITDLDGIACKAQADGTQVLSFTAVIQFATSPVFEAP